MIIGIYFDRAHSHYIYSFNYDFICKVEALMCLEKAYCAERFNKATTGFECRGCYTWRAPSKGVCLMECGHVFCR